MNWLKKKWANITLGQLVIRERTLTVEVTEGVFIDLSWEDVERLRDTLNFWLVINTPSDAR